MQNYLGVVFKFAGYKQPMDFSAQIIYTKAKNCNEWNIMSILVALNSYRAICLQKMARTY